MYLCLAFQAFLSLLSGVHCVAGSDSRAVTGSSPRDVTRLETPPQKHRWKIPPLFAIICWVDFHQNIQDNLLKEMPQNVTYIVFGWRHQTRDTIEVKHHQNTPLRLSMEVFIQWRSKISSFFLQVLMFRGKSSQLPQCQQDYQVARDRKSPEEWLKHFNFRESFHFYCEVWENPKI